MSSCELVQFRNRKAEDSIAFGNSWGGAARIWASLFDKYCKDPGKPYDSWLMDESGRLWKLATRDDLPEYERAVLVFTFDNCIVRHEHFRQLAEHLREFARQYHTKGVCHLDAWADVLDNSDAEAIGLHATSVNSNPWFKWDEETDEAVPFDLDTGKYNEVYDAIRGAVAS